jgi:hypothetical protein
MLSFRTMISSFAFLAAAACLSAADAPPSMAVNYYAGGRQDILISGMSPSASLRWRIAVQGRTIASGLASATADGTAQLAAELPPLRDGVSMKAELVVTHDGVDELNAGIVLHSKRPFEADLPSLTPAKEKDKNGKAKEPALIGIWSPDGNAGNGVGRLLEEHGLKPDLVESPAHFEGKILLVSDIDFEDNAKAFNKMLSIVAGGMHAIVLPPMKGTLHMPSDSFSEFTVSKGLLPVSGFDRSFSHDLSLFPAANGLSLSADSSSVELLAAKAAGLFHSARFKVGSGSVTIICWDMKANAAVSPVPLLLLRDVFKSIKPENKGKDGDK